jgi:hypothetical protein
MKTPSSSSSSGNTPQSRADRRQLLEHNIPMVLLGVTKARAAGTWTSDQIGLIVDCDDRVGRELVVATGGKLADAEVFRKEGQTPTAILLAHAMDVSKFFKHEQPTISKQVLAAPPRGRLYVIVVGSGGAALAAIPDERLESAGDA